MLKQGMESAELADYENGGFIKVKLDKRLSPSKNAERYYKKYAKMKRAEAAWIEQISQTEKARSGKLPSSLLKMNEV